MAPQRVGPELLVPSYVFAILLNMSTSPTFCHNN